jgi:alcohol dehydrogenase class IV
MSLITLVTRIHFADRVLEDALSEELARLAIQRPIVLCDRRSAEGEEGERLADALPVTARPVRFEVADTRSGDADLRSAAALFAGSGCDGIIGLGGTPTLDLARLLGRSGAPVIAIPTSTESVGLGPLGSQYARHAGRRQLVPSAIFCDATLTTSGDPLLTAADGMDALIHCLEAYLSTAYNPPADGMALDGLRRAATNLRPAVEDGKNLNARRELLAAALNGGLAAQKGFGGVEAAARALEHEVRVRHGVLHAAIVPEVLAFNAPAISDRISVIRSALSLEPDADVVATLCRLAEDVGLPVRLSDAGVAMSVVARTALRAAAEPANQTNPRLATPRDYEAMLTAAL